MIDGRRYDFEFAGVTPSHRHTVTVYTKVESRLSVTRVYKNPPYSTLQARSTTSTIGYLQYRTSFFYTLTPPQIPKNYNPLFINKIPPRIHPMTSYPSTELPLCGESNRKPKTPPPSSKYLLFLSPSQVDAKIFFRSKKPPKILLLGGTTRRVPPRYDRDHRFSLVRRGEFLHQLYMEKAYVCT